MDRSSPRAPLLAAGAVVPLVTLAIALRMIGLTTPWGADNLGTAGAFFSIAARNYLRYGYLAHRLIPIVTAEGPPSPAVLYAHHPPLVPLLVSASFAIFGEHAWAARLVPLAATAMALTLLVLLARDLFGPRVALLTLAVASTLPLDAHLAAHVDVQGSVVLAFVLASLHALARQRYRRSLIWFTCGVFADWAALYLPVLLAIAPWPFGHRRSRRLMAVWLLYATALFLAIATWLSSPEAVVTLLHDRALSFHSDQGQPFGVADALRWIAGTYLWPLCTPGVVVVVLVWSVTRVPALVRRPHPERIALLLVLFGLMHLAIGFQGARQHEFWAHYLRPGLPLVCALTVDRWSAAVPAGRLRLLCTTILLAALMLPGIATTRRLAEHPISTRMADAGYTASELGRSIQTCTPRGTGALTSDYFGESAMFYYADRPLAIGLVTPALLDARLERPLYDPPGGAGASYAVPTAPPTCFVLPRTHERSFPELARALRSRFPAHDDGAFVVFPLRGAAAATPSPTRP